MSFESEIIFNRGLQLHQYANTAYPLNGSKVWREYKVKIEDVDEVVKNQWENVKELGLYAHVPFCLKRCGFCEYTVLSEDQLDRTEEYTSLLLDEIGLYERAFSGDKKTINGFDIGGGTPTVLSENQIERIVSSVLRNYNTTENFEMSIETTPLIAATELEKIRAIRSLGIERISMGMQTINPRLLERVGRPHNTISVLTQARDNVREAGFERFNVDLMYGFAHQSLESVISTTQFAIQLDPEFITLYRVRYKGTKIENQAGGVDLEQVNEQYSAAYKLLNDVGFEANIGKNTFSRVKGDPGTSAYLTERVVEGTPYLGMGLGAQSLASGSIYYNQGAASKKLERYAKLLGEEHFPIQDLYLLPPEEIMTKMISVSFYFGRINKRAFQKKFGVRLEDQFRDEISFLEERGLMEDHEGFFSFTNEGKDYVNGVIPLFYSERSKENLMGEHQDVRLRKHTILR